MQDEPEPGLGFSHKMSLKGNIGMLGVDHQRGRFRSGEPGADSGHCGTHFEDREALTVQRQRLDGNGTIGKRENNEVQTRVCFGGAVTTDGERRLECRSLQRPSQLKSNVKVKEIQSGSRRTVMGGADDHTPLDI
jgi:hypothetical protein